MKKIHPPECADSRLETTELPASLPLRTALLLQLRHLLTRVARGKALHHEHELLQRIGPGGELDALPDDERPAAVKAYLQQRVDSGQASDVEAEALAMLRRLEHLERRAYKRKRNVHDERRRATYVYAARFLEYEGNDVWKKAANLERGKRGIAGYDKRDAEAIRRWFTDHEDNGTLPRFDEALFEQLTTKTPRS